MAETTNEPFPSVRFGLSYYYLTSIIVVVGVAAGFTFVQPAEEQTRRTNFVTAFANRDGRAYAIIVVEGYAYDPESSSNVAFFPAYPVLGALVSRITGLGPESSLLIVSHVSLAGVFILLGAYVRLRFPDEPLDFPQYVLLAFGLLPTSFFLRMAYSESLFLFAAVLALYALERHWPLAIVAVIIGFATATRSVGVALLLPFFLAIWQQSDGGAAKIKNMGLLVISCWGVLAFMLFQYHEFDDPLAFVKAQRHYGFRPSSDLVDKVVDLATLEPIRSVYDSTSSCCWQNSDLDRHALFSLHFAHPLYWLLAVFLTAWGRWRGILNWQETSLAAGLLLIPYVLRGHEMCMHSMGRFALTAFPVSIVLGKILRQMPLPISACVLAVSGIFLGLYAALFAAMYRFI